MSERRPLSPFSRLILAALLAFGGLGLGPWLISFPTFRPASRLQPMPRLSSCSGAARVDRVALLPEPMAARVVSAVRPA